MQVVRFCTGGHALRTGIFFAITFALSGFAPVQSAERSGKEVVDSLCSGCHAKGLNGAPRIGDRGAWSARAAQGLSSLTRHALEGIRKMPSHGGNPALTDLEIGRAVTYMVNRSGGQWVEPTSVADLSAERTGEQVVKGQCVKCHQEGKGGAPKIGDREAWVPRLKQGIDTLVRSATRGHGGMPPRGGQANLTDSELRAAILYMFNPASAAPRATRSAPAATKRGAADPNHKIAGGIEFFLGFVKAESLYAYAQDSVERTMHGGIPKGTGYYHVNVSLLDAKTHAPLEEADVALRLEQPGLTSTSLSLEQMGVGAGSYGNYFKPARGTPYLITVRVQKKGSSESVEVEFNTRFQ